jgi:hypothetical protein
VPAIVPVRKNGLPHSASLACQRSNASSTISWISALPNPRESGATRRRTSLVLPGPHWSISDGVTHLPQIQRRPRRMHRRRPTTRGRQAVPPAPPTAPAGEAPAAARQRRQLPPRENGAGSQVSC